MAQFQPVYSTSYPPPAVIINNTPTPMGGFTYGQHPQMHYYPSVQPTIIQQPNSYYRHGGYIRQHQTCVECCLGVLCLSACSFCCVEECCGNGVDCCYNGEDYCCGVCF